MTHEEFLQLLKDVAEEHCIRFDRFDRETLRGSILKGDIIYIIPPENQKFDTETIFKELSFLNSGLFFINPKRIDVECFRLNAVDINYGGRFSLECFPNMIRFFIRGNPEFDKTLCLFGFLMNFKEILGSTPGINSYPLVQERIERFVDLDLEEMGKLLNPYRIERNQDEDQ